MPKQSREGMAVKAPSGSLLPDDSEKTTYVYLLKPGCLEPAISKAKEWTRDDRLRQPNKCFSVALFMPE